MELKVILILLPPEKAGLIIRLIFFIKYKKTFIFFLSLCLILKILFFSILYVGLLLRLQKKELYWILSILIE